MEKLRIRLLFFVLLFLVGPLNAGISYGQGVAHNPQNNTYLSVYDRYEGGEWSVRGQLVDPFGIPSGSEFLVSLPYSGDHGPSPLITYISASQSFGVVWYSYLSDSRWGVLGQLVNADGTLQGTNFFTVDAPSGLSRLKMGYDNINHRYLVVWQDNRNGDSNPDIYGQFVDEDGNRIGTEFVISNASGGQLSPSVAYDDVNQRFLVVWEDGRNIIDGSDIYGQLVNAGGDLNGEEFVISNASGGQLSPSVAYDDVNQRFLVVWEDGRNITDGSDIYGQLVNAGGDLNGEEFVISNATLNQSSPILTYDSINKIFLATWTDHRNPANAPEGYGQFVNSDGTLQETNFLIANTPSYPNHGVSSVTFNAQCGNFLVALATEQPSQKDIAYAIVGNPCPQPSSTLTITNVGMGNGHVVSENVAGIDCGSDCTEAYAQGQLITLTASVEADSVFGGWSGGGCSGTGSCVVTLTADVTVTATFNLLPQPPLNEGTRGTQLTIPGSGFGAKKGKVLIGNLATKIVTWTDTSITCIVKKVLPPVGTHDVTIQLKPYKKTSPIVLPGAFTLRNPELDSLVKTHSNPEEEITITGSFFSTKKGKVYLEDLSSGQMKNCKVTYWFMNPVTGASELRFLVPKGLIPGVYPLKIMNEVGVTGVDFTFGGY